ncbi:histidine kinase [Kibdelosporangium persicum]|uniref:Integral membrane sensor signal transduction histidine kinase n=1 Tax=Kibdelosporangium persicum TaxID=2698649 RepID=A0ABX2EVM1_9PSEU|nr:histidine kinase [Kibdelosporangium persicum]NRN62885.1 Integral membrane sensor signal transduction histidine kinase [Kibdelosporangium persicum]
MNNIVRVEPSLRRARAVTLGSLAVTVLSSLLTPGIGILREQRPLWIVLGTIGVLAFAIAQAGALYTTVTPWLTEKTRRRLLITFAVASVASLPLTAPVGAGRWETWAWIGGSLLGSLPMLKPGRLPGIGVTVAVTVAALLVADRPVAALVILTGIAAAVFTMSIVHLWLWDMLLQARKGREAQARLAATEERLRFARDVHDVLGHDLSVITLKAELAARLAPVDAAAAAREASDVQRLATKALADMREAVHGYRAVDLAAQLTAIADVLRSSGVRCTITQPSGELPQAVATRLAPVLREASTNMLRHSQAKWCTIDVTRDGEEVRMTVTNDGATATAPDRHSSGLAGLADRLAEAGGRLRTGTQDGVFTLEATVRA